MRSSRRRNLKSQKKFSGPGGLGGLCPGCDVDGSGLLSPQAEVAGEQKNMSGSGQRDYSLME